MKQTIKRGIYGLIIAGVLAANSFSVCAKEGFTVCIDPGHQAKGDPRGEPIAPGSANKKARVSSGTSGVGTKKAEYQVNLEA
ncbi:MAG: N-acetylmuramoyl-L-alanine amidase, partial [Clostridia bacterium]|nr:N-acetylmuramoyl-L-alanine amidase [Clostridia bacterium]